MGSIKKIDVTNQFTFQITRGKTLLSAQQNVLSIFVFLIYKAVLYALKLPT